MRRRRVVATLAVLASLLVVGTVVGVGFVSWRSADELLHPDRRAPAWTPANVGLAFEPVAFSTEDGVQLAGWWMPSKEAKAVVVFLHGYGESRNQSLGYAPFLVASGYHVLAFDFRAHGESGGSFTTVGLDETRDVRAAVEKADALAGPDPDEVALVGLSMGAATAINAADALPQVKAIVADSAFASLHNIASNSITHFTGLPAFPFGPLSVLMAAWMVGKDVGENAPVRAAAALDVPMLVIQGGRDTIAFADADGAAIHRAARGSSFWLVPEAAHVAAYAMRGAEYETTVVAFLDRALG